MRAVTTTRSIQFGSGRHRDAIDRADEGWRSCDAVVRRLFALVLGIDELNILNNYVGRDFMTALEAGGVWSVTADSRSSGMTK